MSSYIEVTFINNVLIMMLSLVLAHYLLLDRMSRRTMLRYTLAVSLLAVLCWNSFSPLLMLGAEILSCVFWFKLHVKVFALAYSLRLLFSLTCYVLYGGSFHLLIYFVPTGTYTILYFWVIAGIAFAASMRKWKYYITQAQYIYETVLWAGQKKFHIYGYLDSGNVLTYNEIPIIFAVSRFYEYFKNENIELVVMNTMNQTSSVRVYPCELQVRGCEKQSAYICFDRQGVIPMHCECLLNLHVLTR